MEIVFLDTQQWNYLVERSDADEDELRDRRRRLVREVEAGRLAVLGSWPLFQELAGTYARRPQKYEAMRDLALQAIQFRWLIPMNERHVRESMAGGVLPPAKRFLTSGERKALRGLAKDPGGIAAVADEAHDLVAAFKTDQERIRKEIGPKLVAAGGSTDAIRGDIEEWWGAVDIDSWVIEAVDDRVGERILSSRVAGESLRESHPSAWLMAAFKLARIKLNLGEGRAIKSSDYMDAEHYAVADYVDVLVSDDKAFRSTIELLPKLPCRIESSDDFVARFR